MDRSEIDVGGGCRRIERGQVELPDGHFVKDNASMPGIFKSKKETFYIDRRFDFNCLKMPTSWYFRVAFTREFNTITRCITSIRRTDEGLKSVDVHFVVTIHMKHSGFDDASVKHIVSGMASGQADRKAFGNFINHLDFEELGGLEMPFELFLTVHGCHNAKAMAGKYLWREKANSSDDSDDSLASERMLFQSFL